MDFWRAGALELASALRKKELSAMELATQSIARIRMLNPSLNGLVVDRFEQALREAELADRELAQGSERPLLGVPFTVKEAISVTGMPSTMGSPSRRVFRATEDAPAVKRLRAAGAIPLGVTNVSEMLLWIESDNKVYGRTCNPYDVTRTAGGSSGGEAAMVSSGSSAFGVGSDGGGSIRIPAAFCGVFGHKPTPGLIPLDGHFPLQDQSMAVGSALERYITLGPLARTAADLTSLSEVMAGLPMGKLRRLVDWQKIRILKLAEPAFRLASAPSPELVEIVERAARYLERQGAKIVDWKMPPRLSDAALLWAVLFNEAQDLPLSRLMGEDLSLSKELALTPFRRSRHTLPVLMFAVGQKLFRSTWLVNKVLAQVAKLKRELESALAGDTLLLMPAHPRTAYKHGTALLRPFNFVYAAIFNVTELPATAIPAGLGHDRLPLALQAVAGSGGDALTLAAAHELEKALGGWVPPVS